jgi:hypothetical protein
MHSAFDGSHGGLNSEFELLVLEYQSLADLELFMST